jgi:transcription initiation factor TFIID TATA-box-binding protein
MVTLRISNLIATGHLNQHVDLNSLASLKYAKFDSTVYHCAYVKTPTMISKVSVFSTGKMISVGSKSENQAKGDLLEAARYLAENRIVRWRDPGFVIQNIVLVGELTAKYDLNKLYLLLENSIFEPEQFPGIIHHPVLFPRLAILIFQSGRCVVAGIRKREQIKEIEQYLQSIEKRLIDPAKFPEQ